MTKLTRVLTARPSALVLHTTTIVPRTFVQPVNNHPQFQSRAFTFPVPSSLAPGIQTLKHSRTLPYPHSHIFNIISSISSYPEFLPYVRSATIHATAPSPPPTSSPSSSAPTSAPSSPSSSSPSYPTLASINVGFSSISETLISRVHCHPYHTIEAVSGSANPSLPPPPSPSSSTSSPAAGSPSAAVSSPSSLFSHLLTTWTLTPFPYKPPAGGKDRPSPQDSADAPAKEQTQVVLRIEFQLRNPVYAAMAKQFGEGVGGLMVDAFEKRAEQVWKAERGEARGQRAPRGDKGNQESRTKVEKPVESVFGGSAARVERP